MEKKEELMQVLNDLLKINNDRIEVYKKALRVITEFDVRITFMRILEDSRRFGMKLALEMLKCGGTPHVGSTTAMGKIYRFWLEVKETFIGRDRESILNACEFAEEAVQNAFKQALEHGDLTSELRQIIHHQQSIPLKASF